MTMVTNTEAKELLEYTHQFREWIRTNLIVRLNDRLSYLTPSLPNKIFEQIDELKKNLKGFEFTDPLYKEKSGEKTLVDVDEKHIPLLIRIILYSRKTTAYSLELTRLRAIHPETFTELDGKISNVEKYFAKDWFDLNSAIKIPSLSEYINAQEIDAYMKEDGLEISQRIYDEKFHLLLSPTLYVSDVEYFLRIGELKGLNMCVGYLDIDNFKSFNQELGGESVVDRVFLPFFMRFLASHFYQHGYVYRYGGDEYVVVIPFVSENIAKQYFIELKQELSGLKIDDLKKKRVTLSVGLFYFSCTTPYIPREIEEKANVAKTFAKGNGKNCIYQYIESEKDPLKIG